MLSLVRVVLKQTGRALDAVKCGGKVTHQTKQWIDDVKHYQSLMLKVVDQTQRRVINQEKVPTAEKIVSIFEDYTDIIIKGKRDIQYGHKVNLSTEVNGVGLLRTFQLRVEILKIKIHADYKALN